MGDDGNLAKQVEQIVLNKLAKDRLLLPSMPSVAVRCLDAMKDPAVPTRQLAAILECDPMLAVQVLRVANSAAFGAGGVRSLDAAVTRLGLQRMRSIVVEASTRKLFESRDQRIGRASLAVWEHSIAVGLLARDLAALSGSPDAEMAYLTGLLHDVGKPVVAGMLLEAERLLSGSGHWIGSEEWVRAIQAVHRSVGLALAEKWGLPEVVLVAIRDCEEFDTANRASVANFVRFANALAKINGLATGPVDVEDANALVMVGRSLLGLDDEVVGRLAEDIKGRVQAQLS
jgi:putative nucleotidyltransferase with HDIG domain